MKEKEQFDVAFREVTRNKDGITDKIRKASRDPDVRYISAGVLLEGLAGGMYYLAFSVNPFSIFAALPPIFAGVPLIAIPGTNKLLDKAAGIKPYNEAYSIAASEVSKIYESQQKDPPSKEQIEAFLKKIFYLPPVGHKITRHERGRSKIVPLSPSLTTDKQVNEVIELRKKRELDETYVHQLTVQGKLPDEFKYAALALIINSPYRNDWSKPFFEAHWGKVAPLVHDGGGVNYINPLWKSKGRTDFLHRVAAVYEPELETMEQYTTPNLAVKFSSDALDNAVLEQEERRRLILEANFYQRAAFALHAKIGRVPNAVPQDVARKGMQEWKVFVKSIRDILNSYGANEITKPRWFTRVPRQLPSWGEFRYEGNYKPIQEALTSLEEIKSNNPSLRREVNSLMRKTVSSIDNAIGI